MKFILILLSLLILQNSFAQEKTHKQYQEQSKNMPFLAIPTPIKPNITVALFKTLSHQPVRIVHEPATNTLYTCNTDGWVFKIPIENDIAGSESGFLPPNEHHITHLQGMAYYNNTFILVGNHNNPATFDGYGVVEKCTILSDGTRQWTTMLTTAIYPSSGTLFDHAFAGVCFSKNKDSVYVASGSRTDHGEIKNSGSYTGLREVPLTTKIFRIPLTANGIFLQNNEASLDASGYVFAKGVRNEFDIALSADKKLFGIENSGDRDDLEEMNWLRPNKHYGFPWRMGGNNTPMQYTPYVPSQDKLIPINEYAISSFYNDPSYPSRPSGVTFVEPVKNLGPDANWVRNPTTGAMFQATEATTFTSHRSPVGLVFDVDSTLQMPYTGSGFMLSYSPENGSGGGYSPPEDLAGDLCQLKLVYDQASVNYKVNVTRLIGGFNKLTDAEKVGNLIYATDLFGNIWKITMPLLVAPIPNFTATQDGNCLKKFVFQNQSVNEPMTYLWNFGDGTTSTEINPTHQYANVGNFSVTLSARNPRGIISTNTIVTVQNPLLISTPITGSVSFIGVDRIQATNVISSGANVIYKANKYILMNPGFRVNSGAKYFASIGGCAN
jgi:glucose/arabinose dehydrogenase